MEPKLEIGSPTLTPILFHQGRPGQHEGPTTHMKTGPWDGRFDGMAEALLSVLRVLGAEHRTLGVVLPLEHSWMWSYTFSSALLLVISILNTHGSLDLKKFCKISITISCLHYLEQLCFKAENLSDTLK